MSFFSRLEERARPIDSLLCIGLDPHPDLVGGATADAARDWCLSMIDAAAPVACAFKPNAAFFEARVTEGGWGVGIGVEPTPQLWPGARSHRCRGAGAGAGYRAGPVDLGAWRGRARRVAGGGAAGRAARRRPGVARAGVATDRTRRGSCRRGAPIARADPAGAGPGPAASPRRRPAGAPAAGPG